MALTLATYNVLATAYIQPKFYPFTAAEELDPRLRIPALIEHLVRLQADILCLQEVEESVYAAVKSRLVALGYAGNFMQKRQSKPDGCATFIQTQTCEPIRVIEVEYHDGDADRPHSGHIALIAILRFGRRLLGVANTHLKWDPPATPRDQQYTLRQIEQLLAQRNLRPPECDGWVICGDFNVTPNSEAVRVLQSAGLEFTHPCFPRAATGNSNRRAKMIDFIFHDTALKAEPLPLPAVNNDTPLPGPGQPSDHIAVAARLTWRGQPDSRTGIKTV